MTLTTSGTGLENPSDSSAAGFYITNPYNTLTNNAASGGYSGFFYPVLPAPIGLSRSTQLVPSQRPLLKFDSNTAHSSGTWRGGAGTQADVDEWMGGEGGCWRAAPLCAE